MSSLYGRQILWFMLNAWLHVRVINFRIIIIIIIIRDDASIWQEFQLVK